jgi:hypothetical protein
MPRAFDEPRAQGVFDECCRVTVDALVADVVMPYLHDPQRPLRAGRAIGRPGALRVERRARLAARAGTRLGPARRRARSSRARRASGTTSA